MKTPIYLALDFPNWEQTKTFLEQNDLHGVPVKVGMELFYKEGPILIERLKENGHAIFLDLKLHDIPTTVMRAMENIAKLEIDMVNVHALGGSEMIKLAKEGLINGNPNFQTKLLAVTILTSMDQSIMNQEMLLSGDVEANVLHFATFAKQFGADGVVCSVLEAKAVKEQCGTSFLTVTPGIRLTNTDNNDQKRIATPSFARGNGSDFIVVGRTITKADNPNKAYKQLKEEWKNAGA
ncbi:MAG: orotidine-5'-phosphate decarboxylase [Bacillota bacterium]|uniref:orotidine-5'-phosphate decarboxylase n=1 Tax=Virgibacillus TaxID=84406 RepID=UPI000EF5074E|nr:MULTISPECIES: orotidine-5'-phosphate decarboxylase [Virgibacillus]MCC2252525.1 orotidine-5'-phosphate decarboxylase [Virgibacillus sp. AGTR]MDY7045619.1 orotidine-5'-phosphate decarboxylase [Virgibacillus sp. M23]QRZ16901.1 orotidine-5'-phosphate decarboxylase [Virgibacillus sp. AGTR]WBX79626.1 orotidine-5'-phosphate decarboxylase [Virgibacillus salarius]